MGGQTNLPDNIRASNCGKCGKYISGFSLFKGKSGGKKQTSFYFQTVQTSLFSLGLIILQPYKKNICPLIAFMRTNLNTILYIWPRVIRGLSIPHIPTAPAVHIIGRNRKKRSHHRPLNPFSFILLSPAGRCCNQTQLRSISQCIHHLGMRCQSLCDHPQSTHGWWQEVAMLWKWCGYAITWELVSVRWSFM